MSTAKKPLVLVIMDGWGYSTKQEHNAVAAAKTPTWTDCRPVTTPAP